jgi:hypothetical protein
VRWQDGIANLVDWYLANRESASQVDTATV